MARTPQARKSHNQPGSHLMRVPTETYELIKEWAEKERRAMNQQLATIVEQWDQQQRQKGAKRAS